MKKSGIRGLVAMVLFTLGYSIIVQAADTTGVPTAENVFYTVAFNPASGTFRITEKAKNNTFVREGRPALTEITAQASPTKHDTFGEGQAILLRGKEGTLTIALYPDLPFVFFHPVLRNADASEQVLAEYTPVQFQVQLDAAAANLKTLGTAGLTGPNEHPGSYTFLAVAVPERRNGAVIGWVSQDRGNGVVFSAVENDAVTVRTQLDYGRLPIGPGSETALETLVVGYFDDARVGLEKYADQVAAYYKIALPRIPSGYCTWYSQPYGGASDEKHLSELATFIREALGPYGMDFIQIDDLWQGWSRDRKELDRQGRTDEYLGKLPKETNPKWWWGPHSDFTQHNPKGPYPSGMQPAAADLAAKGFTPGIWLMPFAWDPLCPALIDHPEYFLKHPDGSIYYTYWAGWCLDVSHPEANAFLRESVQRITKEWGFRYLKLDGLYAGLGVEGLYVNDPYVKDDLGRAVGYDKNMTPVERYRMGLRTVREAAGAETFILGCNVSQNMRTLGGSFGLVDAMRIGPDNGPGFGDLKSGPWHGSNRYFLHGRVWHNDPDPVYVRESMPVEHARLICSWAAVTGQYTVMSDWLPKLPAERLDILKRVLPNHGLKPRPVDLFEHPLPQAWLLTDDRGNTRRDVVGFFNWDDQQAAPMEYRADQLGLPEAPKYAAFDFWSNQFLDPFSDTLRIEVPKGSCRVIAVRPMLDRPFVLSTNRHVSQGIVELTEEAWDEAQGVLRGTSAVIAGDPYELRIIAPANASAGRAQAASADDADVTATIDQKGAEVRVLFRSAQTKTIQWTVRFSKEDVEKAK